MLNESCPLPSQPSRNEADVIARLLAFDRIAVVGLSDDPTRTSHQIAMYLRNHGKEITPVNPTIELAMGLKSYPSLVSAPQPVELVNVFRRSQFCADVVRDAIAARAKGVWLQSGISSPEGRKLAERAGIDYIENRCIMVEHMRRSRRAGS